MRLVLQRLRKFVGLAGRDRRLVLEAAVWLCAVRVALWVVPFRVLRGATVRVGGVPGAAVERVVWSVGVVPGFRCLARAMAGRWMLARHGHAAEVRIGVSKAGGEFTAHAWLECGGEAVLGGDGSGYAVLEGAVG